MTLKRASIVLAVAAFLTGLRSALLWYRASRVQIMPMWIKDGRVEPLDPTSAHAEWIVTLLETATKSGDLNRKAAIWTATTVFLATLSTLSGAL
jgi:hypothetical protein